MASPLYVKLDVTWVDNPGLILLGMEARGVHAVTMCLAKRLETDGWVARVLLAREGATAATVDALVDAGLLDAEADRVRPAGWHSRNPSQAAIDASRASKVEAGKAGNHRRYGHPGLLAECPKCNPNPQVLAGCDRIGSQSLAGASPETETETETETCSSKSSTEELRAAPAPAPAAAADEQTIRKTAYLVGRAAVPPTAANPDAYAAGTTKAILTGPDPTDRDRIRQALTDGATPEAIAAMWRPTAVDVARQTAPPPAARPACLPCDNNGVLLDDQAVAHRCPVCNGGTRTDLIPAPTLTAVP